MTILHGDCLEVMAGMEPESVDAIVTDPPYGLSFMGKAWDHGVPARPFWEAMFRVAKPGAYLLAFGGTRTVHRIATNIEDAGWIIRDMLVWGYASGFPKSKASLKPAWEPIVMARKPGPLRMLAIDECRIPVDPSDPVNGAVWTARPGALGDRKAGGMMPEPDGTKMPATAGDLGRWPANIVLTDPTLGSDYSRFFEIPGGTSCDWCGAPTAAWSSVRESQPVGSARSRAVTGIGGPQGSTDQPMGSPSTSGTATTSWLDDDESTPSIPRSRQPGTSPESTRQSSHAKSPDAASRGIGITTTTGVRWMCVTCAEAITSATTEASPDREYPWAFLIPKSARSDREPVLGGLPLGATHGDGTRWGEMGINAPANREARGREAVSTARQNVHPTVKPTDLMRHLVRLVTPATVTVLQCSNGHEHLPEVRASVPAEADAAVLLDGVSGGVAEAPGDVSAVRHDVPPEGELAREGSAVLLKAVRGSREDASAAAVRGVRDAVQPRQAEQPLLFADLLGEGEREETTGPDAEPGGLHPGVEPGAPERGQVGLRDAAPPSDGRGDGPTPDEGRGSRPHQRGEGRQPTREPAGPDGTPAQQPAEATAPADRVPALSRDAAGVWSCPTCGSPLTAIERRGHVLDPFGGSGTTALACELEGFDWTLIEREAEYVRIAEARLNGTQRGLGLDVPAPTPKMPNTHPDLFKHQPKVSKGRAGGHIYGAMAGFDHRENHKPDDEDVASLDEAIKR